ncbi:MAG: NADH-quinone oxidoreductase subunit C [Chloroflexi bacterium]|nr:NADH-quinone oxidoreductase subunit C [Chloroflexota bacterium]
MSSTEVAPGFGLPDELMKLAIAAKAKTTERGGQFCIELADTSSLLMAELFKRAGARFITLTVTSVSDGKACIYYHFDVSGVVYSVLLQATTMQVSSIVDVFPGADWAEREASELYGVAFSGRASMRPLLLQGRAISRHAPVVELNRASRRSGMDGE